MIKPGLLRTFLEQTVPGLAADPARLAMFCEDGAIRCTGTGSLSFRYHYTLVLELFPFAGDVDLLIVPLLAWVARHQPDLLAATKPEPFSFDSEILDGDQVDLTIKLNLSEIVVVTERTGGGYEAVPKGEPDLSDEFDGVGTVLLRRIYAEAEPSPPDMVAETLDADWLADHPRDD